MVSTSCCNVLGTTLASNVYSFLLHSGIVHPHHSECRCSVVVLSVPCSFLVYLLWWLITDLLIVAF